MQKTSVGLHSRGAIAAASAGNTSALPVGSPSGGVRAPPRQMFRPGEEEGEEEDSHLCSGSRDP